MPTADLKSYPDQDLDPPRFRELAAKCRRLASNMSDEATTATLRLMAQEYQFLASNNEKSGGPSKGTP